jgi:hypothetical protein
MHLLTPFISTQEAAVLFAPGTKIMGCMYGPGHGASTLLVKLHVFAKVAFMLFVIHVCNTFVYIYVPCISKPWQFSSKSALQEAAVPFAPGTKMLGCMYGPGHDELLQQDMRNAAALSVQVSATIQVGVVVEQQDSSTCCCFSVVRRVASMEAGHAQCSSIWRTSQCHHPGGCRDGMSMRFVVKKPAAVAAPLQLSRRAAAAMLSVG